MSTEAVPPVVSRPSGAADAAGACLDGFEEAIRCGRHPAALLGCSVVHYELDQATHHPAASYSPPRNAHEASEAKAEGNKLFSKRDHAGAMKLYSKALALAPLERDYDYSRAVFYCNRAACASHLGRHDEAVTDSTAAIELSDTYVKAFEALDKLEDAVKDLDRVLEIDGTLAFVAADRDRLQATIRERQEKMKEEMLGKLKDLGNTILGKFGLSLDNFKMQQDPNTGSYSVNFQR